MFLVYFKYGKKRLKRKIPVKIKPIHFSFVKKNEQPDLSFRRVGVNAGYISTQYSDKSVQSHYFIKLNKKLTNELLEKLQKINFQDKDYTVGPKSISKQELIKEFNIILN